MHPTLDALPIFEVPATLNGYPVIRCETHARCATVMLKRSDVGVHPYVVATFFPGQTGWSQGGYHEDREAADADFREVARSNAR